MFYFMTGFQKVGIYTTRTDSEMFLVSSTVMLVTYSVLLGLSYAVVSRETAACNFCMQHTWVIAGFQACWNNCCACNSFSILQELHKNCVQQIAHETAPLMHRLGRGHDDYRAGRHHH